MWAGPEAYDQVMGRWSRRLSPLLIAFACVEDGERVLDIGCGTGSLSRALLDHGPRLNVTGTDASAPYVEYCRRNLTDPRVEFEQADARSLPFPDNTFDKCLSLLVLNFVPDAEKAAKEIRRVTRPGKIAAAAVWDYDHGMEMLRMLWDAAAELDPQAESKHERNMPLCREGELGELWREAGFSNVDETPLTIGMEFDSFEDYWAPFLGGVGPSGSYVCGLKPDAQSALKERLRRDLLPGSADGPFRLNARAWAVRGAA